jgi:sorbose reductase
MNGTLVQPQQVVKADADGFLKHNVLDLFSLAGRTIVITGGSRGIGLALAFAVAEVGGNVAIVDILSEPHPHYRELERFDVKVKLYKYGCHQWIFLERILMQWDRSDVTNFDVLKSTFDEIVQDFGRIDGL